LFTMQGVEGQIFNPMARTYGYALLGALLATFTVTPVLASYLLSATAKHGGGGHAAERLAREAVAPSTALLRRSVPLPRFAGQDE